MCTPGRQQASRLPFACREIVRSRGRFLMRGHLWRAFKGEAMLVQVLIGFIEEGVLAVQEGLGE